MLAQLIRLSVCLSLRPSVRPSRPVHPFVRSSVRPYRPVRPAVCPTVRLHIRLCIRPCVRVYVVHVSVRPCIRPLGCMRLFARLGSGVCHPSVSTYMQTGDALGGV